MSKNMKMLEQLVRQYIQIFRPRVKLLTACTLGDITCESGFGSTSCEKRNNGFYRYK